MPDNLKEWLSYYPVTDRVTNLSVSPILKRLRTVDKLANGRKIGPSPDCMRHSYATYSIALSQDSAATALSMGHSEQINKLHYRGLATIEQGKAYFNISPSTIMFEISEKLDFPEPEEPKEETEEVEGDWEFNMGAYLGFLALQKEQEEKDRGKRRATEKELANQILPKARAPRAQKRTSPLA